MTFIDDWETPGLGWQLGRFEMNALQVKTIFTYTGAVQFFQVPSDRTSMMVDIKGSPSRVRATSNWPGAPDRPDFGRAIFCSSAVRVVVPTIPGSIINVTVGGTTGWPDGGAGGQQSIGAGFAWPGAGSTSIVQQGGTFRDSLVVIGGAGSCNDLGLSRQDDQPGGACAGVFHSQSGNHQTGLNADYGEITYAASYGGQPGTLTGPGNGGQNNAVYVPPAPPYAGQGAGQDRFGGTGGSTGGFGYPGGGGGGGWYGGGGGGPVTLFGGGSYGGEGGGGSSYIAPGVDLLSYIDGRYDGASTVIFYL